MSEPTTEHIKAQIERKNRWFQWFQGTFLVLLFFGMLGMSALQYQTLEGIKAQNDASDRRAEQNRIERTEQYERIERRLNCAVSFFTQENRDELTIEDIDRCTLNRNGETSFTVPNGTNQNVTEQPSSEATQEPRSNTSNRQEPTTSSPPERPEEPTNPTEDNQPGFVRSTVDGALDAVTGILDAVINPLRR